MKVPFETFNVSKGTFMALATPGRGQSRQNSLPSGSAITMWP
jgi:hypothetical protein